MAKKKLKNKKGKKKAETKQYLPIILIAVGAVGIIVTVAIMLTGTSVGTNGSAGGDQINSVLSEMKSEYGQKWRDLGFTRWTHDLKMTMLYVDSATWYGRSIEEQKKRINQAGEDFGKIMEKNGGNAKDVYIMIHDESERMSATYSGTVGAEVQQ